MLLRSRPAASSDRFHAIEREIHLGRRIIRNFAAGRIAARHAGNKQPVAE